MSVDMKLFLSSQERAKKNNEKQVERLAKAREFRLATFRSNAISKLTFLFPDIQFAMGMTSDFFAGYSKRQGVFIDGFFLDEFIPSIVVLWDAVELVDFDQHAAQFSWDLENFEFHDRHVRAQGFGYNESFRPFDVRILKNGRLVGRSTTQSPKLEGYFPRKAYEHIVQDLHGTGVSEAMVELHMWSSRSAAVVTREIAFIFADAPRKSESQSRDHYIKICSQFVPFLNAIEHCLQDSDWRDTINGIGMETDRQLGLY